MKFSQILAGTVFVAGGLAAPAADPATVATNPPAKVFVPVPFQEPRDYIAGPSLFPSQVIIGFNSPVKKYDAQGWANYVLKKCKGYSATTSTVSYSALNSGTPHDRYWFGYCFRGGPTTVKNYQRDSASKVEGSYAYTIKK
ncbi:hypothetical protein BGZ63DRAFT_456930 [Mariannaea sp. PMI_226]|nr:hypothetical protein BGZ63DRAFT_456930 [Mariannaea sp. PMI_226]